MPVAHGPSIKDIEREERRARKNPFNWLRELAVIVVSALVISSLLRAFIVQVFWIPSASMRNTLVEKDRIAVSRVSHFTGDIKRGDVVVFDDTLGWLALWVMGDNRSNSADSRYHMGNGQTPYVPESAVVGRAFAVIWPSKRLSWLGDRSVFADVPDAK